MAVNDHSLTFRRHGVLPSYAHYRLADLELAQGRVQNAHHLAQQAVDALRQVQGDSGGGSTAALTELET